MRSYYRVNTTYACASMVVRDSDNVVVSVAPIFRRFLGKNFQEVISELEKQHKLKDFQNLGPT
jgi:hypothetical protein